MKLSSNTFFTFIRHDIHPCKDSFSSDSYISFLQLCISYHKTTVEGQVWYTLQLSAIFCVGRMDLSIGGHLEQNTVENKREDSVINSKDGLDLHQSFIMLFIIIFFVVVFTCLAIYIFSIVVHKCFYFVRVHKVRKPFLIS